MHRILVGDGQAGLPSAVGARLAPDYRPITANINDI